MAELNQHLQTMRLQRILSAHGIASRRNAEDMIISGRVSVNGITAQLGQTADVRSDVIEVDGKPIKKKDANIYIMLNKPRGYLTTVKDDRGRKTVMDLVADIETRVYPVGRLDLDSEGLLLLTSDGEFAYAVAHPSNQKTKTYQVCVRGDAKRAATLLSRPINIDGRTIRTVDVKLISSSINEGIVKITVVEGRNRQIRKMCTQCGVEVISLKRISIGAIKLGTLDTGMWRHLTSDEVKSISNR